MLKIAILLIALSAPGVAQQPAHRWSHGTVYETHREGGFRIFEIDTHDAGGEKRCVIVLREAVAKRNEQIPWKSGMRFLYEYRAGQVVGFLDPDGTEHTATLAKQILMSAHKR